jgi:hypothetical protein
VLAVFVGGVSLLLLSRPDETHRRVHVALDVFQQEQSGLEAIRDWLLTEPAIRGITEITETSMVLSVLDPRRGQYVGWTPRLDQNDDAQQVPGVVLDPEGFVDGLKNARQYLLGINAHGCGQEQEYFGNGAFGRFGVCISPRGRRIPAVYLTWSEHEMIADEFTEVLPRGTADWSRTNPRTWYSRSELSDGWHVLLAWD